MWSQNFEKMLNLVLNITVKKVLKEANFTLVLYWFSVFKSFLVFHPYAWHRKTFLKIKKKNLGQNCLENKVSEF